MSKQSLETTTTTTTQEPPTAPVPTRSQGPNTLRNIGLIIGREYKNRLYQRSFIISTVVILILTFIGTCIPTAIQFFVANSGTSQTKMVVINEAGSIAGLEGNSLQQYINTTLNGDPGSNSSTTDNSSPRFLITLSPSSDLNTTQTAIKDGKQDLLLTITRATNQELLFKYYTKSSQLTDLTPSQVQSMATQLNVRDKSARLGLTPEQTQSLFNPPTFAIQNLAPQGDNKSQSQMIAGLIVAYIGVVLIFMSVYMYGYGVATGVAEEKGSRIMEILINAATPFQLMVGKIIGIGAAGLSQMVCVVAVGIGGFLLQGPLQKALLGHSTTFSLDFASISITLLGLLLVYFILGFLLYSTLFAALGALVNRQEEAQNSTAPVMWLLMVGYIISFIGATSSDATWVKVVSFVPFWTPTTMLMRLGAGTVAPWEIALSIVLMLVAIALCSVISARIYRYGILMYGQKPKFSTLLKLARSK